MSKKQFNYHLLTAYELSIKCCIEYLKFNNLQFSLRLLRYLPEEKVVYQLSYYVSPDMINEVEELIKETCQKYGVKVE